MPASIAEIEALYRESYAGFRRGIASVTGDWDTAHDVVQDAFAKAVVQREAFRGEAPLAAWVWRIAIRAAIDLQRRRVDPPLEDILVGSFVVAVAFAKVDFIPPDELALEAAQADAGEFEGAEATAAAV